MEWISARNSVKSATFKPVVASGLSAFVELLQCVIAVAWMDTVADLNSGVGT